jgi:glycerol-3-phosphate dehydrogenase
VKRDFLALQDGQFDVLICGGGIYGAWTAYDAALRGLKVAIVEQGDWASATSSASSKLIHGGLRYLESYDFKLVKKALSERQLLLKIAPHRVWPLRFGVPLYADSRISRLQLKLGLLLYDFLAGSRLRQLAHRYFKRSAFAQHFPMLNDENLRGGFTYGDAQTDDARMALELIAGAQRAGAVCVNYCKLNSLLDTQGPFKVAEVQDQVSAEQLVIQARQVVYTSGPWLAAEDASKAWCRVSKGVHLVLPPVQSEDALLLTARADGRVFFMIPWYGLTLLGTTDTDYSGDMRQPVVTRDDVQYLLQAINPYLKTQWSEADVIGSYAGLRVMKRSDQASPSAVSRDWELKTGDTGVHYSVGGKMTSAREDAATIVDTLCAQLGSKARCASKDKSLPWAPEEDYSVWFDSLKARLLAHGVDAQSSLWLIRRHGNRVPDILREIEQRPALAERIVGSVPFIYADLLFSAQHEMVVHLDDLLRRRMPLLIMRQWDPTELRVLAQRIAPVMAWDKARIAQEVARCLPQTI